MSVLKVNGFDCRYELSGNLESAETVVFINGIASPLESWLAISEPLKNDYRILSYDLRGQWYSEVTSDKKYSFLSMADDLKALMDALGIDKAHLVGTSLGGEIALWFALMYPAKTTSIAAIASVPEANELMIKQVTRWKIKAQEAMVAINESNSDPAIMKKVAYAYFQTLLPELYSNTYLENNVSLINDRCNNFQEICTYDFYQGHVYLCEMFFKLKTEEKLTDRLHEISCPALIIGGEVDLVKPAAFSELIAQKMPSSHLYIFKDVGHAILHERPEEATLLISDHISGGLSNSCLYGSETAIFSYKKTLN